MTRVHRMASAHHRTVQRSGRRVSSGSVRARYCAIEGPPRVGYALPRQVGGAVVRNRIRRRLRACVAAAHLEPGVAVVLSAPASSLTLPFEDLCRAVESVLASASSVGSSE